MLNDGDVQIVCLFFVALLFYLGGGCECSNLSSRQVSAGKNERNDVNASKKY